MTQRALASSQSSVSPPAIHHGMENTIAHFSMIPGGKVRHDTSHAMSMRKAMKFSAIGHLVVPLLLCVGLIILTAVFGSLFPKPHKRVIPDLQFVLVPQNAPTQQPIHKNTRLRAAHATRASGHPVAQAPTQHILASKPVKPVVLKPQALKPTESKKTEPVATEPNKLNPQENETPKAQDSVDALQQADFGPYIKDLTQRIKESWVPPRGNESKKVVVTFTIDKAGKLDDAQVTQSSGIPEADQAAITAVKQTFPFRPLPKELSDDNISIDFTFDYTLFGDKQSNAPIGTPNS